MSIRTIAGALPRLLWPAAAVISSACSAGAEYEARNGDIVFQVSRSEQSRAIQLATHSPYSHMGIVYVRDGEPFVLEAVQPVKSTPLGEWIRRGRDGHFVAKRLRDADSVLSADVLGRMQAIGKTFLGRDYDPYFEWSDERIYCSELVFKIFARGAGVELGRLATMRDFDLSHPEVEAKLHERFGANVPLAETVIAPAEIFASAALTTVYEN